MLALRSRVKCPVISKTASVTPINNIKAMPWVTNLEKQNSQKIGKVWNYIISL
jgi:hypothetical protein